MSVAAKIKTLSDRSSAATSRAVNSVNILRIRDEEIERRRLTGKCSDRDEAYVERLEALADELEDLINQRAVDV